MNLANSMSHAHTQFVFNSLDVVSGQVLERNKEGYEVPIVFACE